MQTSNLALFSLPPIPRHIGFPDLPPINDVEIAAQVFTHSSYHQRPKNPTSLAPTGPSHYDNEKLEHVGDALLGGIITVMLHDLFPDFEAGAATMCKAQLVRDSFLAQISRRYNLPQRFIANPSEKYNLMHGEKSVANLFEAYIAGLLYVYTSRGVDGKAYTRGEAFDQIDRWLRQLYTPLAQWAVGEMRMEQERMLLSANLAGADPGSDERAAGALARLNEHFIGREGTKPIFDDLGVIDGLWSVRCTAVTKTGVTMTGEARRRTKQSAKNVAAWQICQQMGWD